MSKTGNRVTNFLTRIGNFAIDPFSGGTAVPRMIEEARNIKPNYKEGKLNLPIVGNVPELGISEAISKRVYGDKNQRKGKLSAFGINIPDLGVTEAISQASPGKIFSETGTVEKPELGDSYNQKEFMKDLYGLQAQGSVLRDYEMGREAKRNMASAQQYLQMASMANESAARRRLMEDQFSPTKISQQRLRAQQGEAALMNAVANQMNSATNAARSGINPRGRAGGA